MRQTTTASSPPRHRPGLRRLLLGTGAALALAAPAAPAAPAEATAPAAAAVSAPAMPPASSPAAPALPAGEGGAVAPDSGAVPAPASAPGPEGGPGAAPARFPHGGVEDSVVAAAVSAISVPKGKGINRAFVEEVFAEICRLGIREPRIVMRQAMLETGWLRAPFLMKRNNLFGFRYRSYLTFDDWKESVRYYRDWQARRYKDSDPSYYAFLTRIRYGAPNYLEHLRKIRWERDCAPPPAPSPLRPEPAAAPAPAETLAHPDLPARVESIVPAPLGEGAGLPPAAPAADGAALPAPRRAAP